MDESAFIDFECPYCHEPVSFPAEHQGLIETCPSCQEAFLVPVPGNVSGNQIPLPVKTAKLILRRFEGGDWKDLVELEADEPIWKYTEGGGLEEPAVLEWIERDRYVRFNSANQPIYLAVELVGEGKVIGLVSLTFQEPDRRQAALSVWIGTPHQKQGFGLEAADAMLEFCLLGLNLHRVYMTCETANAAGHRFFEKLGVRKEGELVKAQFVRGEWVTLSLFAALREEYESAAREAPKA